MTPKKIVGLVLVGLLLLVAGVGLLALNLVPAAGVVILAGLGVWGWAFVGLFSMERLRLHSAWGTLARDTGLAVVVLEGGGLPGFDRRLEGTFQNHQVSVHLVASGRGDFNRGAVLECGLTTSGAKALTERPGLGLWPFTPEGEKKRADCVRGALETLAARAT